jgi:hypothetical protein
VTRLSWFPLVVVQAVAGSSPVAHPSPRELRQAAPDEVRVVGATPVCAVLRDVVATSAQLVADPGLRMRERVHVLGIGFWYAALDQLGDLCDGLEPPLPQLLSELSEPGIAEPPS